MNKRVLIGGLIAVAVIILAIVLCIRLSKKAVDKIRGTDETTTTQPNASPQPKTSEQPTTPEQAARIYLALGNPSNAGTSDTNNYLMINNYMAICYSRDRRIPNWVAWRVTKADLGDIPRVDSFRPDDRLPQSWARITPADYTNSGFDRGHVCPNADRNGSPDSMASTFVMTNMTPQTPDLNRGPWEKLEAYLRTLVRRGSDVYITAGVYGEGGKVKSKITVPTNDWKIAVAVPAGSDISAVNAGTRVIAVDMPNVKGIMNADWQIYRTTVSQIEKNTGYKFFSNLPPNVQDALKVKVDKVND